MPSKEQTPKKAGKRKKKGKKKRQWDEISVVGNFVIYP